MSALGQTLSLPSKVAAVPETVVSLTGVSKAFGQAPHPVVALERFSLGIAKGEIACLVGASGCGKTTLLNLIAGLDEPNSGSIRTTGGRIALMFQEAALFPWLTVGGNVQLALRLRGVSKGERQARAAELLETVHLGGLAERRPHELSGGMRQRVALARALAQDAAGPLDG